MVQLALLAAEIVRKPGLQEFHTRPDVSHGRRPDGSRGLTYRQAVPIGGQYPEVELRTPARCPVPWQEDGAA